MLSKSTSYTVMSVKRYALTSRIRQRHQKVCHNVKNYVKVRHNVQKYVMDVKKYGKIYVQNVIMT